MIFSSHPSNAEQIAGTVVRSERTLEENVEHSPLNSGKNVIIFVFLQPPKSHEAKTSISFASICIKTKQKKNSLKIFLITMHVHQQMHDTHCIHTL